MARIWTVVAITLLIAAGSIAAGHWPGILWPVALMNGVLGVVLGHLIVRMFREGVRS